VHTSLEVKEYLVKAHLCRPRRRCAAGNGSLKDHGPGTEAATFEWFTLLELIITSKPIHKSTHTGFRRKSYCMFNGKTGGSGGKSCIAQYRLQNAKGRDGGGV